MTRPWIRTFVALAILCLVPRLTIRGQAPAPATCRIRTSFAILEGATRRVDIPDAYLSVFAEEIKDRNDKSHLYVAISDSPLASPSELLNESAFKRRLKSDKIGEKGRTLGARQYTKIDARADRPESLRIPSGAVSLTLSNPVRHRSAAVVLCFS